MDFKSVMQSVLAACIVCAAVDIRGASVDESFIEEVVVVDKKKKLSTRQKKEKIADELKELARTITHEIKQLAECQELVIDRLDELVNNDKQGVFSGASDAFLEKAVADIEALRAKNNNLRKYHHEQKTILKHGCAQ